MASQVVTYSVDGDVTAKFEIDPVEGFEPAGVGEIAGRVRDAIGPAVEAARAVLDQARSLGPDGVSVTFGVKVTGQANWFIAKAAAEGNFEVTLSWSPKDPPETPEQAILAVGE